MAFFCPIFPKTRIADYEDVHTFQFQKGPPRPPKPAKFRSGNLNSRLSGAQSLGELRASGAQTKDVSITKNSYVKTVCAAQVPQFRPYTRGRVNCAFTPTVDDELAVQLGEFVRALYREDDWLYVINEKQAQGFIPAVYCQLYLDPVDLPSLNTKASSTKNLAHLSTSTRALPTCLPKSNAAAPRKPRASVRRGLVSRLNRYLSRSTELRPKVEAQKSAETSKKPSMHPAKRPVVVHKHRERAIDVPSDPAIGTKSTKITSEPPNSTDSQKGTRKIVDLPPERRPQSPETQRAAVENVQRFLDSLNLPDETNGNASDSSVPSDPRAVSQCTASNSSPTQSNSTTSPKPAAPQNDVMSNSMIEPFAVGSSSAFGDTFNVAHPLGTVQMSYTFLAREPDDLTVERGDTVTLLNMDDPDWYWVQASDGHQGFVPAVYIDVATFTRVIADSTTSESEEQPILGIGNNGDRGLGQELVVCHAVTAEAEHDLTLLANDWVYTRQSLSANATGWLWVFCPRLQRSGFVPASAVAPPITTVL